jgi:DNA-binding protein YbaB
MLPNFGGMNPQKMLQKMQDDMMRLQEQLDAERLETSSGGGMVKVTTSGMGEVLESTSRRKSLTPTMWKCCKTSS